jgi:peptide/nickel transport system substrate-binding protein
MLLLSLLVIFALVLSACGGGTTSTQKSTVLTVSNGPIGAYPQNFNPLLVSNANPGPRGMIYEMLLYFNWQQGTINPWLASSYQWSSDATSVTFHLRPNVQWSDGQPFTSADVVFTRPAQDAPAIHAGEEWAFLIGGRGGRVKRLFVHHFLLLDRSVSM